jgi:homoserine dehydrogenase
MTSALEANNYKKIVGILNGTTNYILTMMKKKGLTFDVALAQAQKLGYAEQDPTADIEGLDSQRKIAILADIAYGETISPDKVYTEGITKITPEIMTYAESKGYQVKLICYAEKKDGGICIFVSPCAVSAASPLAGIEGVFNGVTVSCDCADDMTFIGRGAGSLPTASAVVADIIDGCMLTPAKEPLWKNGGMKIFGLKDMDFPYLENTSLPIIY